MTIKTLAAVLIASTVAATTAFANDAARFQLVNTSGQTITRIQVSPSSSNSWGGDLLGTGVLAAGNSVIVTPGPSGCMFDVRVTYSRGGTESFQNVNLCRTTRISFANSRNATFN